MTESLSDARRAKVYCGNYLGWASMFEEPPECSYEAVIPLGEPEEDEFATWICPGCGMTNTVRGHQVHDG